MAKIILFKNNKTLSNFRGYSLYLLEIVAWVLPIILLIYTLAWFMVMVGHSLEIL
ncbi:hypothetical protein [Chryseotalea sanaruensis]|uniref:hypothetical protein n=1 Tax=Chryseotalea sanaruensis TaxID=2482724 RepID=UPI00135C7C24|nr:hypothetical protein [Chryseotalea sanaruensis]